MPATPKARASSDELAAEIQKLGREQDALRERRRKLRRDLDRALVVEGKAVPALTPEQQAEVREFAARLTLEE